MQLLAEHANYDPATVTAAMAAMGGFILICALIGTLFTLLVYYFIIKRTGYNPWLSLLMLVPLANFVLLIILAFTEWPVQRENRELRARLAGGTPYPGPAPYPDPPPYAGPTPPGGPAFPPPPGPITPA